MAVCDANYRFTFVDIGAFGRASNAGVFGRTKIGAQLIQGLLPLPPHAPLPGTDVLTPPVFVADEAFPQKINLMRSYPGSLTHNCLTTRRCTITGIHKPDGSLKMPLAFLLPGGEYLEGLWSVQLTQLKMSPKLVWLSNFLSKRDQSLPEQTRYIPPGMIDRDGAPGEWRQMVQGDTNLISTRRITATRATQDGMTVRETFKEFFQTDQGKIDWQDRHVRRGTLNNVA